MMNMKIDLVARVVVQERISFILLYYNCWVFVVGCVLGFFFLIRSTAWSVGTFRWNYPFSHLPLQYLFCLGIRYDGFTCQ